MSKMTKNAPENAKLDVSVLNYLRGRKADKHFAGGAVRFADIMKALDFSKKDERALDRALQRLRKQKKVRYASRAGWEIWE